MAGLEVVVRPIIFPDIRPRAKQSLPPQDDPEKGIAKIDGQPARQVTMSSSVSVSSSHSKPVENERRVDEVRVYQEDDDGTINKDNFIDTQVANRITLREPSGGTDGSGEIFKEHFYQPVQEKPNIEVTRKNVIMRDGEEFSG